MERKGDNVADRMLIGDWSGKTMLSTAGDRHIGPSSWGLLERLAANEAFAGTGFADGSPYLVSGIDDFFPGLSVGGSFMGGSWSFIEWAPEPIELRLRRAASRRAADHAYMPGRRVSMFETTPSVPRVAAQRVVDDSVLPEDAPRPFVTDAGTDSGPVDGPAAPGQPAPRSGARTGSPGARSRLMTALRMKSRPEVRAASLTEGVFQPGPRSAALAETTAHGTLATYEPAEVARWEETAAAEEAGWTADAGESGESHPYSMPFEPGPGVGLRPGIGPASARRAAYRMARASQRIRRTTQGLFQRGTTALRAGSSEPERGGATGVSPLHVERPHFSGLEPAGDGPAPILTPETDTVMQAVAEQPSGMPVPQVPEAGPRATHAYTRTPSRPGPTVLSSLIGPAGARDEGIAIPGGLLRSAPAVWERSIGTMGATLSRMVAGAGPYGHPAWDATGAIGHEVEPFGPPTYSSLEPGQTSTLAFPHSKVSQPRTRAAAGGTESRAGPVPSAEPAATTARTTPASVRRVLPERTAVALGKVPAGEGIRFVTMGTRRAGRHAAAAGEPPGTTSMRVLVATGMASRARARGTAAGPVGPRPVRPLGSVSTPAPMGMSGPDPWTSADLGGAPFLPASLLDIPVRHTSGLDIADEAALLQLGHRARTGEHATVPATSRAGTASMFGRTPEPALGPGSPALSRPAMESGAVVVQGQSALPMMGQAFEGWTTAEGFRTVAGPWQGHGDHAGPEGAAFAHPESAASGDAPALLPLLRSIGAPARGRHAPEASDGAVARYPAKATIGTITGGGLFDPVRADRPTTQRPYGTTVLSDAFAPAATGPGLPLMTPTMLGLPAGGMTLPDIPPGRFRAGTFTDWSFPEEKVLARLGLSAEPETGVPTADHPGRAHPRWVSRVGRMPGELASLSMVKGTLSRSLGAAATGPAGERGSPADAGGNDLQYELIEFLAASGRLARGASAAGARSRVHGRVPAGSRPPIAAEGPEMVAAAPLAVESDVLAAEAPVRPSRIETSPPGVPRESEVFELSLPDMGSTERVDAPRILSTAGATLSPDVAGAGHSGPSFRGVMPLVSPAISAVAGQAMASRREPGDDIAREPSPTPQDEAKGASGARKIDMDALAMEMAERIMRRMKRDKERRGLHG